MRALRILCLICAFSLAANAQQYGNEWINFSQKYFKIPVPKEGVYRIDSTTLAKQFDLNTTNPKNFQLFIRGKEQFIYVKGESDNKVNSSDFIEFYTDGNPAPVDSLLYTNISYQPSPYLPIFNDTLYAFITTNNLTTNKRFTEETDVNINAYPAANYFYSEKVFAVGTTYNAVDEYNSGVSDPNYTQAEGRGTGIFHQTGQGPSTGSVNISFGSLSPYTGSNLPAYIAFNGSGYGGSKFNVDHRFRVYYADQSNTQVLLKDTSFGGFLPIRQTYTISSQNLNNASTITFSADPSVQYSAPGSPYRNYFVIHYAKLVYPQTPDLLGSLFYKMHIDNAPNASKSSFSFSNFNFSNSSNVELFDLTNGRRIKTTINGLLVEAVVPNGSGRKLCVITGDSSVIKVKTITPVNKTGFFTDYKLGVGSKPFLIVYSDQLQSSSNNYANYRRGPLGGSYDVVMANISALYEQFSYGVNQHPIAIKNFVKYLYKNLPQKPNYLLLIGHGINHTHLYNAIINHPWNLVPAMGIPASDNLYTTGLLPNTDYLPSIPVGRIAALNNTEVENYRAKVESHDNVILNQNTNYPEWKKNVLHFVGGDDVTLLNTLSSYMSTYSITISDTLYGAYVRTFKKNTTSPVQNKINDSIFRIINDGCSIITFFGHGSLTGLDQAIDNPLKYNNTGKYPLFIANSCNSGDIFYPNQRSVSENFLFTNQKGSVGFIAAASFGQDNFLYSYTNELYKAIAYKNYGQAIGHAIIEAINKSNQIGLYEKLVSLDMAYHGDPSLMFNVGSQPDYQVANSGITFDLKKYTDSVGVNITYKNAGVAKKGNISMRVHRLFPNGDSVVYYHTIKAPLYRDTLRFYIPIDFSRGYGLNKFSVHIDFFNQVAERLENNNTTVGPVNLFIPGGDIYPVYPYNFAVVPKTNTIVLKASTSDPFAPLSTYRLQLDTCDRFVNPIQSTIIKSKGGVIEWTVNLPFADSTVYFWRVSRDSIDQSKPFFWRESSFQTVGTKRGWGQSHFHQFKADKYQFVKYRKDLRKFSFENVQQIVSCRNGLYPDLNYASINYFFNTIRMSEWGCAPNGWNIAIFDSISGEPKRIGSPLAPIVGPDSNCVCNYSLAYYSFGAVTGCPGFVNVPGTTWQRNLNNFINTIPANNYVLAFTMGWNFGSQYANVSSYSNSLYNAFESFGAKTIRTTLDTVPYILFGRKGMTAGQGHEIVGKNARAIITLEDSIKTRWRNGYVASDKIGPSNRWNSLHWQVNTLDNKPGDTTILKVVGFKTNGTADTLATFRQNTPDVLNLGTYADAATYPYLQLVALMYDNINSTSPQLKRWQVLYDEAPELALNPLKGFSSINDTLQEGDEVVFRFPIENIGTTSFSDSLVITYWIEDARHNKIQLPDRLRKGPFVSGELIIDTVKVNSYQLIGNNGFWISVNPLSHKNHQKEQHLFNNIGRLTFKVDGDVTNPLLDVTFDGVRILNGDIVSAKPNILISLKDENKFLALNDTSAFSVFLQSPNQSQQQRIYFAQGLIFTPANLPKNSCSIQYKPVLPVDGKYTLLVQAKDRSQNLSGQQDYRIDFEVNNKPTITGVLNYPNPFTTSTKFVFTLTGSEIPEVFTIQIMTITGKIVREITRDELGQLRIGRNITDYAWDGKDRYGDRLATGVYLYRVITRLNGETIEKSATAADKYFVKEYGKMVLIR